ncbi:MAG: cephalosporin hydroxylase family protein [Betaproteobacteria bacterium]
MNPLQEFQQEVAENISALSKARGLQQLSSAWLRDTLPYHYSYNFAWLGRPIIQYPQDIVAMQELVWLVKPDLIIETGIAHGGSLVMSASLLAMLDYCDAIESHATLDPGAAKRKVLGIDIDIRPHNRQAIESHPMSSRIVMLQGSSTAPEIIGEVHRIASAHERIMVCLDSNHTHDHVVAELQAYAPLVCSGSYCIVFDTVIEELPSTLMGDRPWGKGNSPMTAVGRYLSDLSERYVQGRDGGRLAFEVDTSIDSKLLISVARRGYLRRV